MAICYKATKTTDFLEDLNKLWYLCGQPNLWVTPVAFSDRFVKVYDHVSIVLHCSIILFNALLPISFITQTDLTPKQHSDRFIINLASPMSNVYNIVTLYHREKVRHILEVLMMDLKSDYNDKVEEATMIKKIRMYCMAFLTCITITAVSFGLYGLYQVKEGSPFVTVITVWPDVKDTSTIAEAARVFFFFIFWVTFWRLSGAYMIVVTLLIGLSQQYRNLQSYFYSLNDIFKEGLGQIESENKYVEAFSKGIEMHIKTIWCLNQTMRVCQLIFDAEMLLGTATFVSLLPVLMSPDRDMSDVFAILPIATLRLIATGVFMWNAGDITVEASQLADAMYSSGWENCSKYSTKTVRKLVVISMNQAQQPVILRALGVIEMSYNGYLGIIKLSHSVFSVFY